MVLNAWHGNPAQRMSKSGMKAASTLVMSVAKFPLVNKSEEIDLKFASYVFRAYLSISVAKTHSALREFKAK